MRDIPGIYPPITKKNINRGAFYGYRPFVDYKQLNNIKISKLIKMLQAEGMEIRLGGNRPLHQLPLFSRNLGPKYLGKKPSNYKNYTKNNFPASEYFYNNTLSLITFTFEDKKLINQYIEAFRKVFFFLASNKKKNT